MMDLQLILVFGEKSLKLKKVLNLSGSLSRSPQHFLSCQLQFIQPHRNIEKLLTGLWLKLLVSHPSPCHACG